MANLAGQEVWVLEIWDRHGSDVELYASAASARAALLGIAVDGWENLPCAEDIPATTDGLSDEEIVEIYFGRRPDEGYALSSRKIEE